MQMYEMQKKIKPWEKIQQEETAVREIDTVMDGDSKRVRERLNQSYCCLRMEPREAPRMSGYNHLSAVYTRGQFTGH